MKICETMRRCILKCTHFKQSDIQEIRTLYGESQQRVVDLQKSLDCIPKLKTEIENKNYEIARLTQEYEYERHACANAVSKLESFMKRSESTEDTIICMCCLGELENDVKYILCNRKHIICSACMHSVSSTLVLNMDTDDFVFACPVRECSGAVPYYELAKLDDGMNLLRQWNHTQSMKLALKIIEDDKNSAVTRLYFSKFDGTYLAYQCSECHYGPMIYSGCTDLLTHHMQYNHINDIANDNRCPKCGHLHTNIDDMNRWDGRVYAL